MFSDNPDDPLAEVTLDGYPVSRRRGESFIEEQLTRFLIMEALVQEEDALLDDFARRRARLGVFVSFRCPVVPTGGAFGGPVHVRNSAGRVFRLRAGAPVLLEAGDYTAWVDDKHWVADPASFRAESAEVVVDVPVRRR